MKVFVYGTLKMGRHNNFLLTKSGAKFIGEAETAQPMSMVIRGSLPFLFNDNNADRPVLGELWEVPDNRVWLLDDLEGHPEWYRREEIKVNVIIGGEWTKDIAWAYLREEKGEAANVF